MSELHLITKKIISSGKGILADDESTGTMTKRLSAVNINSTPENRLLFREILFSSECMKDCIGGVILYDETINQTTSIGKSIPDLISSSGDGCQLDLDQEPIVDKKYKKQCLEFGDD